MTGVFHNWDTGTKGCIRGRSATRSRTCAAWNSWRFTSSSPLVSNWSKRAALGRADIQRASTDHPGVLIWWPIKKESLESLEFTYKLYPQKLHNSLIFRLPTKQHAERTNTCYVAILKSATFSPEISEDQPCQPENPPNTHSLKHDQTVYVAMHTGISSQFKFQGDGSKWSTFQKG